MNIDKFEFAEGVRLQKGASTDDEAAGRVGHHIELLRAKHGGQLTPEIIVDDARHDNSPLHDYFEWSDGEAARQFRLQQARGLIRSVVAVYSQPEQPQVRARAYVHISEPVPHYLEVSEAMSDATTRAKVLKRALGELIAWKKRYKDLNEFAGFIHVIDKIDEDFPNSLKEVG
jgi:hypothetical protein